jgi:uncharacterized membrane protein YeaQ/YmgE (transglycosylase-associated protein family)
MSILAWVIFGLIAGLIIHSLIPKESKQGGILMAVLFGILGSVTGGFISNLIFGQNIGNINTLSLSLAFFSTLLLLFVGREVIRE